MCRYGPVCVSINASIRPDRGRFLGQKWFVFTVGNSRCCWLVGSRSRCVSCGRNRGLTSMNRCVCVCRHLDTLVDSSSQDILITLELLFPPAVGRFFFPELVVTTTTLPRQPVIRFTHAVTRWGDRCITPNDFHQIVSSRRQKSLGITMKSSHRVEGGVVSTIIIIFDHGRLVRWLWPLKGKIVVFSRARGWLLLYYFFSPRPSRRACNWFKEWK